MEERYIANPRPMFDERSTIKEEKRKRLEVGSKSAGVILDMTKDGLYFNGYYSGFHSDARYSNIREPGFISWENLEKAKKLLDRSEEKKEKKRGRKRKEKPVEVTEEEVDQKYLDKLPIVTIAGKKYYIDPERRERRSVETPNVVTSFSNKAIENDLED